MFFIFVYNFCFVHGQSVRKPVLCEIAVRYENASALHYAHSFVIFCAKYSYILGVLCIGSVFHFEFLRRVPCNTLECFAEILLIGETAERSYSPNLVIGFAEQVFRFLYSCVNQVFLKRKTGNLMKLATKETGVYVVLVAKQFKGELLFTVFFDNRLKLLYQLKGPACVGCHLCRFDCTHAETLKVVHHLPD